MSVSLQVGWFIVPNERHDLGVPGRWIGLNSLVDATSGLTYNKLIAADGGSWNGDECLGDMAVCKVLASAATLAAIAGEPLITHIPVGALGTQVNTLTTAQQNAIKNRLLALGYSGAELNAAFPLGFAGPYTIRQVLAFALGRRLRARYDVPTAGFVHDGQVDQCLTPDQIDAAVANG